MKRGLSIIGVVGVAVVLAAAAQVLAFSEPTQAPPNGDVNPPINTGSTQQTKSGGLILSGATTELQVGGDVISGSGYFPYVGTPAPNPGYPVLPLVFLTGGNQRATIDSSGNFGIGNSNPAGDGTAPTVAIGSNTTGNNNWQLCLNGNCTTTVGGSTGPSSGGGVPNGIWKDIIPGTAGGPFTVPLGVTRLYVEVYGGGGAGELGQEGGGGGAGGVSSGFITVVPGQQIIATVGAGGIFPDGNGQGSSFSSSLSATGGNGGNSGTVGLTNSKDGNGGSGSSSGVDIINQQGGGGGSGTTAAGGSGGSNTRGGGGSGSSYELSSNSFTNGNPGGIFGGGGGGGAYDGYDYVDVPGGNGGVGGIIVEY